MLGIKYYSVEEFDSDFFALVSELLCDVPVVWNYVFDCASDVLSKLDIVLWVNEDFD